MTWRRELYWSRNLGASSSYCFPNIVWGRCIGYQIRVIQMLSLLTKIITVWIFCLPILICKKRYMFGHENTLLVNQKVLGLHGWSEQPQSWGSEGLRFSDFLNSGPFWGCPITSGCILTSVTMVVWQSDVPSNIFVQLVLEASRWSGLWWRLSGVYQCQWTFWPSLIRSIHNTLLLRDLFYSYLKSIGMLIIIIMATK